MYKIKQIFSLVALSLGLICFTASFASAQSGMKNGDKVTIQGEVLDMACYMSHEAHGQKHASCAETCVKGGAPMGILDKDGNVYLVVEDHQNKDPYADMVNYAAKTVSVTGTYYDRGGTQGLVLESVEEAKM